MLLVKYDVGLLLIMLVVKSCLRLYLMFFGVIGLLFDYLRFDLSVQVYCVKLVLCLFMLVVRLGVNLNEVLLRFVQLIREWVKSCCMFQYQLQQVWVGFYELQLLDVSRFIVLFVFVDGFIILSNVVLQVVVVLLLVFLEEDLFLLLLLHVVSTLVVVVMRLILIVILECFFIGLFLFFCCEC